MEGWRTPKLFDGLNYESKGEDIERRSWGAFPGSQHFGGKKGVLELWNGTRKIDKHFNHSHMPAQTKPQVG
jgi:hypothetical protein